MRFFGLIFLAGMGLPGIGLLAGSYYFASSTLDFREQAKRTTGVIEAANPPRAKFYVEDREYTVTGSVSSDPPAYQVGEKVEVMYLPGSPDDARLDGFLENWFAATLLGGLGTVFTSVGLGIFFFSGRWTRRLISRFQPGAPPVTTPPVESTPEASAGSDISYSDRQTLSRILRMGARSEAVRYAQSHLKLDERAADRLVRDIEKNG